MENEIWADVRRFEDKYQISNTSKLRSKKTGLLLKPQTGGCPYYYFMFYDENIKSKQKRVKVMLHRLVAEHFIPNPYFRNEVNHKDGNKLNCSIDNLEWVSKSENSLHAVRTGLSKPSFGIDGSTAGENNVNAKLNWEQVREIRRIFAEENKSYVELGEMFDVSHHTVREIIKGLKWKDDTYEPPQPIKKRRKYKKRKHNG